jgi:hypothetical protein
MMLNNIYITTTSERHIRMYDIETNNDVNIKMIYDVITSIWGFVSQVQYLE